MLVMMLMIMMMMGVVMMMMGMMMMMGVMMPLTDPAGLLSIEHKRVSPKIPPSPLLPSCVRQTAI